MSDLRTLAAIAVLISVIVGAASYAIFHVPTIYCLLLSLVTGVMFFFIILWSSYLFIYK